PTIRAALKAAARGEAGQGQLVRHRGVRRSPGVKHHSEIEEDAYRRYPAESIIELAKAYGVSRNTVARALDAAYDKRGKSRPHRRGRRPRA
ncbi:MAG: hypothetical protein ACOC9P_02530, partial [bacterium]